MNIISELFCFIMKGYRVYISWWLVFLRQLMWWTFDIKPLPGKKKYKYRYVYFSFSAYHHQFISYSCWESQSIGQSLIYTVDLWVSLIGLAFWTCHDSIYQLDQLNYSIQMQIITIDKRVNRFHLNQEAYLTKKNFFH